MERTFHSGDYQMNIVLLAQRKSCAVKKCRYQALSRLIFARMLYKQSSSMEKMSRARASPGIFIMFESEYGSNEPYEATPEAPIMPAADEDGSDRDAQALPMKSSRACSTDAVACEPFHRPPASDYNKRRRQARISSEVRRLWRSSVSANEHRRSSGA